jgi:hypothetical protein
MFEKQRFNAKRIQKPNAMAQSSEEQKKEKL